jgi:hypothetical protein
MHRHQKSRKKVRTLSLQSDYELGPMFIKYGHKEHGQGSSKRKVRQGVKFGSGLRKMESNPRSIRTFRRQARENHNFRPSSIPKSGHLKVRNADIDSEVYRKAKIKNSYGERCWDSIENPNGPRRATKKNRKKESGLLISGGLVHHHSKKYWSEGGVPQKGNPRGEELRMDIKGRIYVLQNQEKIYIRSKDYKRPLPQGSAIIVEPRQRDNQSICNSNAHMKNNPIPKVVNEDFRSFRPGYQSHYSIPTSDEPILSESWDEVDIFANRTSNSKRHHVERRPKSKSMRTISNSRRVETANEKWEIRKKSARKKARNRLLKKTADKGLTRDKLDINIKSDNRELRRLEKLKIQEYLKNGDHSRLEELHMESARKVKKKKKPRKSRFSEAVRSSGHRRMESTVSDMRGWKKENHHVDNHNKLSKAAVKKQLIRDLETVTPQKSRSKIIKASSPRFSDIDLKQKERDNLQAEAPSHDNGGEVNKWALMLPSSQDDDESENGSGYLSKIEPYAELMYEEKVNESTLDEGDYQLKGWQCSQESDPETEIGIEKQSGYWDYSNIEDLDEAVKQHKEMKNKEKLLKERSTKSRKQVIDSIRQSPEQDLSPLPLEKAPRRFWPESFSQEDIPVAFDSTHDKSVTNTKWRILE